MIVFWFIVGIVISGCLICDSTPMVPQNLGWLEVASRVGNLTKRYQPLSNADSQASVNARYFVEKFRPFFDRGLGAIPPLDPYTNIKPAPAQIDTDDIHGTINLGKYVMTGPKAFNLDILEIRLNTARVDFSVGFPVLEHEVDYYAKVKVDQAHNYFAGHANVSLHNVAVLGAFSLTGYPQNAPARDQTLEITAIEYELSSSKAQYNLRDSWLRDGNQIRQRRSLPSANKVASFVTRAIAQEIAEQSSHVIALAIVNVFNRILSNYTAAQILAMLLPEYHQDSIIYN